MRLLVNFARAEDANGLELIDVSSGCVDLRSKRFLRLFLYRLSNRDMHNIKFHTRFYSS